MTESKKEEASAAKTQKKSAISDDFGNDFFTSWKSMSVAEDDGLDFNQEVLPKGKKNMFNFDKLDMNFSLDGDFGKKMSSFNVDMSDLDFSSPAKKPSKAKEGSTEESLDGKQGGKQSCFNISFDFNELDNFDFDSNFTKGKSKSEKAADLKGFDSPRKQEKAPCGQSKPVAGVDLTENSDTNNTPVSQHLSTSKFEHLDGAGKSNANIDSSSTSVDFGNLSQSHRTAVSPLKETTVSTKETGQSSQQSERTVSTEGNTQNTIQGSSTQSISMEGSGQEAALTQGDVCSSATEYKTSPEEAPDISVKGCDWKSSQPVHMSGSKCTKNESKKMLEKQSDIHMGDASGDDSMRGDMIMNDSSAGSSAQNMLHGTGAAKENCVKSKLTFEAFHSEPKTHQPVKEKGSSIVQSKYLNKIVETEKQLNFQSTSAKVRLLSSNLTNDMHSNPADHRWEEHPASDEEAGNQRVTNIKLQELAVKKGVSVVLGNGKNGENTEMSSRLPEETVKSTAPRSLNSELVSSIASIRNSKNNFVEVNKLHPLHFMEIIVSPQYMPFSWHRLVAPNNTSHPLTIIKSPRTSTVSMEKRILTSPNTKRKTPEAPDADQTILHPLKRASPSPSQCRGLEETSKRLDNKRVHCSPIPDILRDGGWKELQQVPLLIEDDGNIEKAEVYSKELDDICNMLKKKHDEAKELLVRAIVNNNQLLMLNHPIYVEKIRMVEQFANIMVSPACQV
ncbi:hypothetical protein ACHQM5_011787 [Ranunculus cassubicifolius]